MRLNLVSLDFTFSTLHYIFTCQFYYTIDLLNGFTIKTNRLIKWTNYLLNFFINIFRNINYWTAENFQWLVHCVGRAELIGRISRVTWTRKRETVPESLYLAPTRNMDVSLLWVYIFDQHLFIHNNIHVTPL
jgi:hypothetical protein